MKALIKVSGYRASVYKEQFPTGTWLEVKGLAVDRYYKVFFKTFFKDPDQS